MCLRAQRGDLHFAIMPSMTKSLKKTGWTAYDQALLRSLRIKAPSDLTGERNLNLLYLALALLVPGLGFLALWIGYLVRMWD